MIKAILIDDEQHGIETLQSFLADYCPEVTVAGTAQEVNKAYELIQYTEPDLVFLDIQMPGQNGFQLLKKFKKIHFQIIFVTAYSEYAIQAFKFSAADYLLKPLDIKDLIQAVQKVLQRLPLRTPLLPYQSLLENIQTHNQQNKKLLLPLTNSYKSIPLSQIIYCEADRGYTNFFLRNEDQILISKTLMEYEKLLSSCSFFRIHQSYLVNLHQVEQYLKNKGGRVKLSNGDTLPVSRNKKEAFLKQLYKHHLIAR